MTCWTIVIRCPWTIFIQYVSWLQAIHILMLCQWHWAPPPTEHELTLNSPDPYPDFLRSTHNQGVDFGGKSVDRFRPGTVRHLSTVYWNNSRTIPGLFKDWGLICESLKTEIKFYFHPWVLLYFLEQAVDGCWSPLTIPKQSSGLMTYIMAVKIAPHPWTVECPCFCGGKL